MQSHDSVLIVAVSSLHGNLLAAGSAPPTPRLRDCIGLPLCGFRMKPGSDTSGQDGKIVPRRIPEGVFSLLLVGRSERLLGPPAPTLPPNPQPSVDGFTTSPLAAILHSAPGTIRTCVNPVSSRVLYPLRYGGECGAAGANSPKGTPATSAPTVEGAAIDLWVEHQRCFQWGRLRPGSCARPCECSEHSARPLCIRAGRQPPRYSQNGGKRCRSERHPDDKNTLQARNGLRQVEGRPIRSVDRVIDMHHHRQSPALRVSSTAVPVNQPPARIAVRSMAETKGHQSRHPINQILVSDSVSTRGITRERQALNA